MNPVTITAVRWLLSCILTYRGAAALTKEGEFSKGTQLIATLVVGCASIGIIAALFTIIWTCC